MDGRWRLFVCAGLAHALFSGLAWADEAPPPAPADPDVCCAKPADPTAAAVGELIAEAFAIRSWIYHALNGGLSAAIGWALVQDDTRQPYRFLTEPKAMVAAGLAGGLAYWLVAGWTAGFWKPVFRRQPAPVARVPVTPRAEIQG